MKSSSFLRVGRTWRFGLLGTATLLAAAAFALRDFEQFEAAPLAANHKESVQRPPKPLVQYKAPEYEAAETVELLKDNPLSLSDQRVPGPNAKSVRDPAIRLQSRPLLERSPQQESNDRVSAGNFATAKSPREDVDTIARITITNFDASVITDLIRAGQGWVVAETTSGNYVASSTTDFAEFDALEFKPEQNAHTELSRLEAPMTAAGMSATAVGMSLTRQIGVPVQVNKLSLVFAPALASAMLEAAQAAPKSGRVTGCITRALGFAVIGTSTTCR
jgi:hypothetical protein